MTTDTTTTRADRVADTIQQLETGLQGLADSDRWAEYLRTVATFHNYSPNNVMLILAQREHPTQVAGYKAWQKLGRQVRKGETGIKILAPLTRTIDDEETGDKRRIVRGFRAVSVFDIAQTDGEELPTIAEPLDGMAPAHAFDRLRAVVSAEGITLTRELSQRGENGYYIPGAKRINVTAGLSDAQCVKTLAHELAHHFTGTDCTRADGEIIAESVAYVVANALGLDSSGYTFGYVLHWAGGNLDAIRATTAQVQSVAHTLIDTLEGN